MTEENTNNLILSMAVLLAWTVFMCVLLAGCWVERREETTRCLINSIYTTNKALPLQ